MYIFLLFIVPSLKLIYISHQFESALEKSLKTENYFHN